MTETTDSPEEQEPSAERADTNTPETGQEPDSGGGSPEPGKRYEPGEVVAGRFKIVEPLGSSDGGTAYLVTETEKKRRMVLKHLAIPYVGDAVYDDLRKEIKDASGIRHKNLVRVFGLGKEEEDLFLAMEYVDGQTLSAHLAKRRDKGQVMGLKAAYNLMAHVCNALQVVHDAGTVHGALTTRNLYVTRQGRVKVANLVYARLVSSQLVDERRGAYFDSPFVAPEARDGAQELTPAADLYSLGLLTAELLSDTSLEDWEGTVEEFIEHVVQGRSQVMQELLFNAVITDPSFRMDSAKDFKSKLKEAVDAPTDAELSSIVMGMSDVHKEAEKAEEPEEDEEQEDDKKPDLFDLPDVPQKQRELFDSGIADTVTERAEEEGEQEEEIWLVQKDGLDYGPFTRSHVLEMLYRDEINENTSVLNMISQRRTDLQDISDFRAEVLEYIPKREERLAKEAAERERRIEQVKTGAKVSVAGLVAAGLVIIGLSVFAYLQLPDPAPIDFKAGVTTFPRTFETPKIEEVALNVDTSEATAIFDPAASEAEREAALAKWAEEHRKRIEAQRKKSRRSRRARRGKQNKSGSVPTDEELMEGNTIAFGTDEDGNELEPLDDWEVEEQLYSARSLRKQSDCFAKHPKRGKVVIKFVIRQSGQVAKVSTTASGPLDSCLSRIFRSMRFRQYGGTLKRVTYPIEFG